MEVILLVAVSADGFIARSRNDRSFDWTCSEDKQLYVDTIKKAKAVVMSSKSFQVIKKFPRGLTYAIYTRNKNKFKNHRPDVIKAFPTKDSPKDLIKKLEKQDFNQAVIAGGSSIFTMFLQAKLVTKIIYTIEPILFGTGIPLLTKPQDYHLKLLKLSKLGHSSIKAEYLIDYVS